MRTSNLTASPLAAALIGLLSTPAHATDAPTSQPIASTTAGASIAAGTATAADAQREPTDLDRIQVQAERQRKASSPKYTQELVDTPQTITVVTKQTMDQQNLLGLREVLSTLPGITFGAGEGGGGYGDSINLRGFSASSDITTDGIRDSALYTRSDTFNLEAIEVVNGANSVYQGAGSVGGNINLVSKMAREGDAHTFTLGAGSDRYGRATADSNFDFGNGTALRLNAMGHTADVPGRDEEFNHRRGFAASLATGLGSPTRFTLNYMYQRDNNMPQYGVPYALNAFNGGPLPGIDRETYFGYRNTSRQQIEANVATGILEMDFGDNLSLRSLGRVQRVDQLAHLTALQGAWCLDSGINAHTGAACTAPGTWNPNAGPRGLVRDTRNAIAASQTDLTARFGTGPVRHTLVAGLSLATEKFELDSGNQFLNANGTSTGVTYPLQTFRNPYNIWTGPNNYFRTARTVGELTNAAVYAFDTLEFGPRWMLTLGARQERNQGSTRAFAVSTAAGSVGNITGPGTLARNDEDLFSWRAGVVFKPVENASVYLSHSNSKTPSKASVNGACTLFVPGSTTGAANCDAPAETAVNTELGVKWDLADKRLALTAAIFRNDRQNYRVADPDPANASGQQSLDGRARVDGITLGAAGNITREWAVFANYAYLDSEVLSGVSDYCAANPNNRIVIIAGVPTAVNAADRACSNSTFFPDPTRGNALTSVPKHSGSLWTTYALDNWTFGYGLTYQGRYITQNSSLPTVAGTITAGTLANPNAAVLYRTDDYWVHRAMVAWQVNDAFGLQLNLDNLFDEAYYERIRNTATSGWATPGVGRSAVLTATYRF